MKYQAEMFVALSEMRKPPPPPYGIDFSKPCPAQAPLQPSIVIQALPWTGKEPLFESDVVLKELRALESDHKNLIKLGEGYGAFDAAGKCKFIDMVEDVEAS